MNKPTFRTGEIILSDGYMGEIVSARHYVNKETNIDSWVYEINVTAQYQPPVEINQFDVVYVWRNNKWTGVTS